MSFQMNFLFLDEFGLWHLNELIINLRKRIFRWLNLKRPTDFGPHEDHFSKSEMTKSSSWGNVPGGQSSPIELCEVSSNSTHCLAHILVFKLETFVTRAISKMRPGDGRVEQQGNRSIEELERTTARDWRYTQCNLWLIYGWLDCMISR